MNGTFVASDRRNVPFTPSRAEAHGRLTTPSGIERTTLSSPQIDRTYRSHDQGTIRAGIG
ncbi:hypothetical protein XU06_19135 [Rhodococcus erythropolis]|nr:hypothetical protein XU06_19135 [Rhodococcus erythropolis]